MWEFQVQIDKILEWHYLERLMNCLLKLVFYYSSSFRSIVSNSTSKTKVAPPENTYNGIYINVGA